MQTRILTAQIFDFSLLDRLNHILRNQFERVVDTGQILRHIQKQRRTRAEQVALVSSDDSAVFQLDSRSGSAHLLFALFSSNGSLAVVGRDFGLGHQPRNLVHLLVAVGIESHLVQGSIVTAYNFVLRSLATNLIVGNAEAHHVHTHIGRRLVRAVAINTLKERSKHRERLDIAVVVDSHLLVSVVMEGIDHIHVAQIGRSRLVSDVNRVLQRQIPNREGFELGVTGINATLVFLIKLREADRHLTRARPRSGNNHQRT